MTTSATGTNSQIRDSDWYLDKKAKTAGTAHPARASQAPAGPGLHRVCTPQQLQPEAAGRFGPTSLGGGQFFISVLMT